MGSRIMGGGAERVYSAAGTWVEQVLRTDGSLFTPGKSIWSSRWLGDSAETPPCFFTEPRDGYRMPRGETLGPEES